MTGWPDPDKPGMPLNPEVDGFHWIGSAEVAWAAEPGNWRFDGIERFPEFFADCSYHGPCPAVDRRRMKKMVRKWLLVAGVRRRTAYVYNHAHQVARKNIEMDMRKALEGKP